MAALAPVSVLFTTLPICSFTALTQKSLKFIYHGQFWETGPVKSYSKDKSCAGSPGSRGTCPRMGGEMGEEDGKGVAANLGAETWGWREGGGADCQSVWEFLSWLYDSRKCVSQKQAWRKDFSGVLIKLHIEAIFLSSPGCTAGLLSLLHFTGFLLLQ